jgi:ABC-type multidrug transport system permease subunit
MADREAEGAAHVTRPADNNGMTRGIAHAITVVLAAFVAAFVLLFLLARAQEDAAVESHPLDFVMGFYGATGIVQTFAATAIVWIAVFVGLSELMVAAGSDRPRALRTAIVIQLLCFGAFVAVWYLPL